jgi:hypothetical protein
VRIKSIIGTQQLCYGFSKNLTYTLAGFESGPSVPGADKISTARAIGGNSLKFIFNLISKVYIILSFLNEPNLYYF